MKVLVTGGTGFLGRHLVWRLAREGAQVVFTGRRSDAAELVARLAPAPVHWRFVDHGSADAAQTLAECADSAGAVVHCAALASPWGPAEQFRRANVASTDEVLRACKAAGVTRLVHISTPSVYFEFRDRIGIREDEPLPPPVNAYAATKLQAEELIRRDPPLETAILRPRAIFGAWDETLLPRLLRVVRKGRVPLVRGGRALLDLTYVDNVVDAIWLALTRPLPATPITYNVSNGEPLPLARLLETIGRAFVLPVRTLSLPWPVVAGIAGALEAGSAWTGREPMLTRYSAGLMAFSATLDVRAIERDLGYRPNVSIEEGLRRCAQWYAQREALAPS